MKKRFNKILSMLLAVAMVVSCIQTPVYATGESSDASDGIVYAVVDGNAQVTDGKNASGDIVIPGKTTIDGIEYDVTSIAGNAFNDANEVTSIVVPDSVTTLGGAAFANMDKLKSIKIGNGVTSWGSKLAVNNYELETVVIAEGATLIGDLAFRTCPKLANVTLPSTLKTIGATAFAYSAITELDIPASVETIGADAFKDIDTLKKVKFNSVPKNLGTTVFQMCDGLEEVVLPEGLTVIPQGTFRYCTSLKTINFPESLTEIGNYSFQGCTSLESVKISKNITNLVTNAFNGCTSLKNLTIEEGFAGEIGGYAFQGCTALESVVIPSSMETVGESMFNMCSNLKNVTLSEGVKTLNISAFANCTSLETLTLPDSLERMRHGSIANCTGLKTLIITGENLPVIEHSNALDGLSEDLVVVYSGDDEFTGNWAALANNVVDELAISGVITEDTVWNDGDVVKDITIKGGTKEDPIEITVNGTVTVKGTISLNLDTISNVVFKGNDNAKLIRGGDFTGQMFYAEGVSGNFQNLTFNNITLDGGAVWTGEVDKTLNRGTTNEGVKATGSVLYLVYADAVMNNSTLQNHDDSTGENANAVFLRYYSTIDFNNSVVRNNNSISTYYRGGVVTVRQGGTVKTDNAEVYGNSGPAGGFFGVSSTGAFGGVVEAKESKFHNNYSDNGAVFLMQCNSKKGYLQVEGCEFYENASKTAVLTEWAYSRPFIIKDSYFHDNECAVWDCHTDPVLDISGKFVVKEDADYSKYLFETPLALGGSLSKGSSIAMSEASITKLMTTKGYIATGTVDYEVKSADLEKFALPEGSAYELILADVDGNNILDVVPVKSEDLGTDVVLTLKDSKSKATQKTVVYSGIACLPVCEFEHEGYVFAGWIDKDGNSVTKQKFTEATTLTAQWKLKTPVVTLSRDNATLKATVANLYDDFTYTYQWYKGADFIEDATEATYTMTDAESATYKCVVTATDKEGLFSIGEVKGTSSAPAAATIDDAKYSTLAQAVAAANTVEGGATVTLLQNVTLGEKLAISGDVTISGEHKITRADDYTGTLFTVNEGATLTLDGGLVVDGANNWTLNTELYDKALKREVTGVTWEDLITSEEGAPNATAPMFKVTGSVVAKNVTIQNNYSNKSSNNGDYGAFQVDANANLTMTGAQIKHIVTGGANSVAHLSTNSVWTINDGTLISDTFAGKNGGVCRNDSGKLVMNGGEISNNNSINTNGTVVMLYKGSMEMNGGKICSNTGISGSNNERCAPIYGHSTSTYIMTGGEICHNTGISYGGVDVPSSIKVEISGGYIGENISALGYTNADVNGNSNTVITGGTFTQDVTKWLAPDTGLVYDEETSTYGLTEDLYEYNGKAYKTMAEVIAAVTGTPATTNDETSVPVVKVLASHKVDDAIVVDTNLIIDLNEKTITGAAKDGVQVYPVIRVQGGADVTVKNGTITNADYVFVLGASDGSSAGNLTIESGKYHGDTTVASVTKGTLTINGGEFSADPYEGSYEFLLNCIDANYKDGSAKIEAKGGTFHKFNPADNAAEGVNTSFVAERYGVTHDADNDTYTVAENYAKWIKEQLFAGNNVTLDKDVVITDYDLVNALKLPSNGNGKYTEVHGNGAVFHVIKPGVVLDLNGHSITWDAHHDDYCNKRQVSLFMVTGTGVEGEKAELTVKDSVGTGKVDVYGMGTGMYVVGVDAKATIDGGTWTNYPCKTCEASNIFMYPSHGGKLFITGGTFEQKKSDYLLGMKGSSKETTNNGVGTDFDETKVEITGGTFVGMNPGAIKFFDYSNGSAESTTDGCANGFAPVDNGDGTYGVTTAIKVSAYNKETGEKFWIEFNQDNFNLQYVEMMDHDNYNWVLTISDDVVVTEPIVVNKDLTINLNGHTLTGEKVYPVIRVQSGANVTVKNGTITNDDYVFVLGSSDMATAGYLTIEDGTYHGATTVASVTKGTLTINGGEFSVDPYEESYEYLLNCVDASYNDDSAKIKVSGGTFKEFNPADNAAEGKGTNFVAKGYKVEAEDNIYHVVSDQIFEMHLTDANGEAHWLSPMRSNDLNSLIESSKVWYDSLQGTYDFTLKLRKDVTGPIDVDETVLLTFPMTVDLDGKRINATQELKNTPVFRVLSDVTFTNSVIDGGSGINSYAFIVGNNETAGTLTITGGTYRGVTSAVSITNGTVNISGGTFQTKHDDEGTDYGTTYMLNCVDSAYAAGNAKYNVTGGTFKGFNPADNAAEGEGTNFVAEGYAVNENDGYEDGIVRYVVVKPVVEMDGKYYTTIKDALATLRSADTTVHKVKILQDHDIDVNYSTYNYPILVNGFAVEIDLNGKTITADWSKYAGTRKDNALIGVCNGGKLTIIDSSEDKTGTVINNDNKADVENRMFWIMTSTASKSIEVNILGGNFIQNETNTALLYVQGNKPSDNLAPMYVNIKGGYFETVNDDFFNAYDGFQHESYITGGTFNKNPEDWEIKIHPDYTVTQNADGTYGVVKAVARINDVKYDSLTEAFDAAKSGETVVLLKDEYEDTERATIVPAGVTFDLNGKVLIAKNVLAFGDVIDSATEVGGIKISNNTSEAFFNLQPSNGNGKGTKAENMFIPLYDSENGCYRMFEGRFVTRGHMTDSDSEKVKFAFSLYFVDIEAYNLIVESENVDANIIVDLVWTGRLDPKAPISYHVTNETLVEYAKAAATQLKDQPNRELTSKLITLTVSGLDKLKEGDIIMVDQASFSTNSRAESKGGSYTYSIPAAITK